MKKPIKVKSQVEIFPGELTLNPTLMRLQYGFLILFGLLGYSKPKSNEFTLIVEDLLPLYYINASH
jgi:hypothetical protein